MEDWQEKPLRYGYSLYNGEELIHFGKVYYEYMQNNFTDVTHLLCSSSSGMGIACAISMYAHTMGNKIKILYIKNPEFTFRDFSCTVNGDESDMKGLVVVDDLIDSGATISHIIDLYVNVREPVRKMIKGIVVWKIIGHKGIYTIRGIKVHTMV